MSVVLVEETRENYQCTRSMSLTNFMVYSCIEFTSPKVRIKDLAHYTFVVCSTDCIGTTCYVDVNPTIVPSWQQQTILTVCAKLESEFYVVHKPDTWMLNVIKKPLKKSENWIQYWYILNCPYLIKVWENIYISFHL